MSLLAEPGQETSEALESEVIEDLEPEEAERLLVSLGRDFDDEDKEFRQDQLIKLEKHNLFWDGAQRLFWDESRGHYIDANGLHTPAQRDQYKDILGDGPIDRVVNIYRPHGESIIAAMSVGTPVVQFFPDDADETNDITTAKAYSKIANLLQKHNNASILYIKALFILYNQGLVAGYNYTHRDARYGTFKTDVIEDRKVSSVEPNPGTSEDITIEEIIPQVVGTRDNPKVRECLEVYGPLHVQVPSWCRKQEDIPVLTLRFEQHVSTIRHVYKDKFDAIKPSTYSGSDAFETQRRLKPKSNVDDNLCTLTVRWFRPSAFAGLQLEDYNKFIAKYPKGVKVVQIDEQVLEIVEEPLDDHWTITFPIFSETIHSEPQGASVLDIQEIRNDVINNADETIRQAITDTFVDPKVVGDGFFQNGRRPGQYFPAVAATGKSLSDGFHQSKPASLSQELDVFIRRLDSDAQFCSGAFPSIFGGPAITGSKTAAEYSMSRAQALQRLSTYWKMMSLFWAQFIGRGTVQHARNLVELNYDERDVIKKGGGFTNIVIKRAELDGKVGKIEPESSDNFPITSSQKRDIILKLLEMKNEVALKLMYHPQNSQVILEAIGMPEIHLPGADDRNKQLEEISELIKSGPNPPDPNDVDQMTGLPRNPEGTPTIPIDPDADDDEVHIQVGRAWMVSELGRYERDHNPDGYLNVALHVRMHMNSVKAKMAQPTGTTAPGQPPDTNATGPV